MIKSLLKSTPPEYPLTQRMKSLDRKTSKRHFQKHRKGLTPHRTTGRTPERKQKNQLLKSIT